MTPDFPAPYDRLLDAEIRAFVARSEKFDPPPGASVAERRRAYDAMCRALSAGRPAGIAAEDRTLAGVPTRRYSAGGGPALLLYLHGGGFVLGGLESHDDVCAELCARTGLDVVAVAYRLAPEHPHPAALEDCRAVYAELRAEGRPVVLAGDSAGGCLAAALAAAERDRPPAGQVLIYPALGGDPCAGSCVSHAEAPMLTRADVVAYNAARSGGRDRSDDPSFAPLRSADFTGLPPTVAFAAECDPLADDARAYCARIAAAGGRARCVEGPGLVHAHLRARHASRRAGETFDRVAAAIAALARGAWPFGEEPPPG